MVEGTIPRPRPELQNSQLFTVSLEWYFTVFRQLPGWPPGPSSAETLYFTMFLCAQEATADPEGSGSLYSRMEKAKNITKNRCWEGSWMQPTSQKTRENQ